MSDVRDGVFGERVGGGGQVFEGGANILVIFEWSRLASLHLQSAAAAAAAAAVVPTDISALVSAVDRAAV